MNAPETVRVRRLGTAAALALTVAFFLQAYFASRQTSLTWDEPSYIAAGYLKLTRGAYRLNPAHPPLMQYLEALPLLLLDFHSPSRSERDVVSEVNPTAALGRSFVFGSGNDPRRVAFWARLPVVVLGSSLVLLLFIWGRSLYGTGPALLAASLAAFCPNLLAHAQVATEDMGCTALMFAAVWRFWRGLTTGRLTDWVLCGLVTGLALLAKYTALLLAPIFLLAAGGWWLLQRTAIGPGQFLRAGLVVCGLAVIVVAAGYGFPFGLSLYGQGLAEIYADVQPDYDFYLFGEVSERPFWYYALAAFAVKVPVLTMALIGIAAVRSWRDREHRETTLILVLPALVIIAASFFDRYNLGLRRILPAFPFLLLFTAQAAVGLRGRARPVLVAALFAGAAIEAVQAYPHHLSHFNVAAGGPPAGPGLLDDSNIDWGQDLPALAAWQRSHPEATPLRLLYFGTAVPAAYGVDAAPIDPVELVDPRPGYYAVSVHYLVGLRKAARLGGEDTDWLTKYRPVATAGHSLYVYKFPDSAVH